MSNNMPRHSREKSGTGIYQMIIGTVPLILTQVPTAIFTLRQILFLCEYFPNANA